MTEKTIEDMVHEYAVAQIQSGKPVISCDDVKRFCLLARDIKQEARRAQKTLQKMNVVVDGRGE
ncbi:hypothetical protein NVT85_11755 [Acinetobacter radioresistens]|uniref:hypothetical protein n=1 Tax=Acinetobacter radioresistens TaxID=40216 RepID=UPI002247E3CB|nr:hypothetical protein [Acinetobacter radioresistens]MCX0337427.1 hypothetical protein [Acinetobacter radioresistens]